MVPRLRGTDVQKAADVQKVRLKWQPICHKLVANGVSQHRSNSSEIMFQTFCTEQKHFLRTKGGLG